MTSAIYRKFQSSKIECVLKCDACYIHLVRFRQESDVLNIDASLHDVFSKNTSSDS